MNQSTQVKIVVHVTFREGVGGDVYYDGSSELDPDEFFWVDVQNALRQKTVRNANDVAEIIAELLNDGSKARAGQ
jgi:hypothetical protein